MTRSLISNKDSRIEGRYQNFINLIDCFIAGHGQDVSLVNLTLELHDNHGPEWSFLFVLREAMVVLFSQ